MFLRKVNNRALFFRVISWRTDVFLHILGLSLKLYDPFQFQTQQYRLSSSRSDCAHAYSDSIAIRVVSVVCTGIVVDCCAFGSGGGTTDRCVSHARQLGSNYPRCHTYTPHVFEMHIFLYSRIFQEDYTVSMLNDSFHANSGLFIWVTYFCR